MTSINQKFFLRAFVAVKIMRFVKELIEIGPNEVCDIAIQIAIKL